MIIISQPCTFSWKGKMKCSIFIFETWHSIVDYYFLDGAIVVGLPWHPVLTWIELVKGGIAVWSLCFLHFLFSNDFFFCWNRFEKSNLVSFFKIGSKDLDNLNLHIRVGGWYTGCFGAPCWRKGKSLMLALISYFILFRW